MKQLSIRFLALLLATLLAACSTSPAPKAEVLVEETLEVSTQSSEVAFGTPQLVTRNFGQDAGYWRVAKHVRELADVSGDGKADIVGFGNSGVFVSLATESNDPKVANYGPVKQWSTSFGYDAGWRRETHPRYLVDVNKDKKVDIVGFSSIGVYVALSNGASFNAPQLWSHDFGSNAGWFADKLRHVVDVTGDGLPDIVGFSAVGVYVARNTGGGFGRAQLWSSSYGDNTGWQLGNHPRFVADVNGDGRADIVGFSSVGVYTSLSTGTGFSAPQLVINTFGYNQGWRVEKHPRYMADVNGDGRADVVGFGGNGTYVSLATGAGFGPVNLWTASYGYDRGWRTNAHLRYLADVNGDNKADVVAFGFSGTYVSLSDGSSFAAPVRVFDAFSYSKGWRNTLHPRPVKDVNDDGKADIVGFSSVGVFMALSESQDPPQDPPVAPDEVVYLQIEPAAVLLTGKGQTETLTVKAYDAEGKALSTAGLGLEWLNSDPSTVEIVQDSNQRHNATIRSLKDIGSAVLSVRSSVNPELISPPLMATIAKVKADVKLLTDEFVVPLTAAPPKSTPGFRNAISSSNVTITFSADEIFNLYDATDEERFRFPILLEGTALVPGDLVLARQSAGVMGRVISVLERDNQTLAQLEEVTLSDVYDDLVLDFNADDLIEQGVVTPSSLASAMGFDEILDGMLSAQALADFCKLGATPGLKLTLKEKVNFDIIAEVKINLRADRYRFRLGFDAGLSLQAGATISTAFKASCRFPILESKTLSLPFPGPVGALLGARIETQPVFTIAGNFNAGPKLKGTATLGVNLLVQVGYDNLSGNLSKTELTPKIDASHNVEHNPLDRLTFELSAGVFQEAKAGLQLFPKQVEYAESIAEFFGSKTLKAKAKALQKKLFFQVLKGKIGPEAKAVWESPKLVVDNEDSKAGIGLAVISELKLESPELNKALKKLGFKKVTVSFNTTFAELKLHDVFAKDTISAPSSCPDDVVDTDEIVCVYENEEVTFTIKVNYKGGKNPVLEALLDYGEVWLDKEKPIATISQVSRPAHTMTITLTITEEMCNSFLDFLAYNKLWAIPTAGYAGKVKLVCRNQPPLVDAIGKTTSKNTPVPIDVGAVVSDPDGDKVTISLSQLPKNGTATLTGDVVSYTPNKGFGGEDIIIYTAKDTFDNEASAQIRVFVDNQKPDAVDDYFGYKKLPPSPVVLDVLKNDKDPDSDTLVIKSFTQPQVGSLVLRNGKLEYTPSPDFRGEDIFEYTIEDRYGINVATDTAVVQVFEDPSLP